VIVPITHFIYCAVEIWNPGNFPAGYKPLDFVNKDLPSILRNPLIANILFLSEDVEKWGSGLRRIYEECASQGVKVKFEVLKYGFSVVFYRSKLEHEPLTEPLTEPLNVDTNPLIRER